MSQSTRSRSRTLAAPASTVASRGSSLVVSSSAAEGDSMADRISCLQNYNY